MTHDPGQRQRTGVAPAPLRLTFKLRDPVEEGL